LEGKRMFLFVSPKPATVKKAKADDAIDKEKKQQAKKPQISESEEAEG